MVIEGEIATTHLIERVLSACELHGITYRKKLLSSLKVKDFHSHTIPLFVRCGDPSLDAWISLLHRAGHPYLYYIDDNFWHIEGKSPLARYYQHPLIRRTLENAVANATCVLTNSDELATFLGRFNKRVSVLPAFFDFSLISQAVPEETKEIRIGFAGSPSRIDDLEIVRPLISQILKVFPDVVFEFAGALPRGVELSNRVRFFSHTTEYSDFIRFQAERNWAIGLAPLIDNSSNRCKTNNKYREYGACKIAGIYSDLPPYQRSVIPGVNGLIIENTAEAWFAAISYLILNRGECKEIGMRAYDDVRDKHCVERVSEVWANGIEDINKQVHLHPPILLQDLIRHGGMGKSKPRLRSLRVKVAISYIEGGPSLVIRRSIRRILKALSGTKQ